jgi:hypothetical protein
MVAKGGPDSRKRARTFVVAILLQILLPCAPFAMACFRSWTLDSYALIVCAPMFTLGLGAACKYLLGPFGFGFDADPATFHLPDVKRDLIIAGCLVCVVANAIDRWATYIHDGDTMIET